MTDVEFPEITLDIFGGWAHNKSMNNQNVSGTAKAVVLELAVEMHDRLDAIRTLMDFDDPLTHDIMNLQRDIEHFTFRVTSL